MWNMEIKLPKFKFLRELQWWPLFAERTVGHKIKMSLGKCAFWLVLIPAMYTWTIDNRDIKPAHTEVLYALIAYNLAKKSQFFGGLKSPSIAPETDNGRNDGGEGGVTVNVNKFGSRWKESTTTANKFDQGDV